MTPPESGLMLEHLKRFQATLNRVEQTLDDLVVRTGQLEVGIAGLRRDFAHAEGAAAALGLRVDGLAGRLDRVERRLDLD